MRIVGGGGPFDPILLTTLKWLAHCGYTEGFLHHHTYKELQNYEYDYSISYRQQFVGDNRADWAEVWVKNKFSCSDSIELMTPQGNIRFNMKSMTNATPR
ncbi:hypothetical protein BG74_00585 [Sodalis-like endosymbiont of Proechinophthirus fluctus]|nr:hypothetical protein BG74_00585 [Sodalis-like endosymbiont of Proechinophthirus fluctus]